MLVSSKKYKARIEELEQQVDSLLGTLSNMERYVESERILGIKHFCNAFRANATLSESTVSSGGFYGIATENFDALEREYTKRSYGKK